MRKIITDSYRDWDRARIALDRGVFEKMLAPGFTIQQPGRKLARQEFIDGISVDRPDGKLTRYNTTVLTVQSAADGWVAVIQEKVEIEAPGGNKGYSLRVTRAGWKQEDNRWLITYAETIGRRGPDLGQGVKGCRSILQSQSRLERRQHTIVETASACGKLKGFDLQKTSGFLPPQE